MILQDSDQEAIDNKLLNIKIVLINTLYLFSVLFTIFFFEFLARGAGKSPSHGNDGTFVDILPFRFSSRLFCPLHSPRSLLRSSCDIYTFFYNFLILNRLKYSWGLVTYEGVKLKCGTDASSNFIHILNIN